MAINLNAKSTTYPSFTIGKNGATIYQGTSAPTNGSGKSGDLYLYINGGSSLIYQNQNGTWSAGAGGGGTGSVTSVNATGSNGVTISGGPITGSGALSISLGNITPTSVTATGTVSGLNLSGTNTGDQTITLTGDITGSGTGAITTTLGTTGVTAGTYQGLVVNAKGLITSATNQNYGTGSLTSIITGSGLTGGTITGTGTIALGTVGTAGTYNNVTTDSYGRVTAGSNVSYLTNNQNITISGDASGAGSTSITLTLGTTGVTAGTGYNNFTVNAKGLITSAGSTNYLTTNQNITITGDVSGNGSTAITLTLGTSGVTAGTYGNGSNVPTIVVDTKGRITNISTNNITFGTGSVTNIATGTGLTGGPITNTGTIAMGTSGVSAGTYGAGTSFPQIVVDGLGRITSATTVALGSIASQNASNVNITGGTITGLPTPVNASDAANKAYVDNATTGLTAKASSRVATTGTSLVGTYNNGTSGVGATFTLTGTGNIVIDSVTLNVNDRVLVKDQTASYQNGIYSVTIAGASGTSAVLTRTTDFNGTANISEGAYTVIEEGTINKGTLWLETGQGPFTIGTTSVISFTELTVAPQTIAITGDATGTGAGTINITLDTVNSNVGTFGNTTNIPTVTVNAKGLVTAISNNPITFGTGSVTSIIAGTGLTGGTINGTGTIAISTTGVTAGTYQGLVVNSLGQITSASNQSYLTSNQNITVTGDVSGSGSTAITLTLGSVVSAGTYNNVVVGTKGLVTSGSNVSYLTNNQSITISGDASGAGSTAIALTLGTTGVTAGTGYNTFTVNAKGLITSASTVAIGTGSVTSIIAGTGLTGGTIVGTGTIALGTTGVTAGTYQGLVVNALGQITSASNQSYLTSNQTITISGDATGTGGTAIALTLGSVNSNSGTFTAVTVGSKGLITAATNIVASGDVTGTASGTGIALTLGSVNANVGTFTTHVVNAKGLVTAAGNLVATGDATGTASGTSIALTLGNSGATAGTYNQVTVNAKGLVTSGTNVTTGTGSVTSIVAGTSLTGGTITNTGTINLNTANINTWTVQQYFAAGLQAYTLSTQGFGARILADGTTGTGILQFTNNAGTIQTGSISSNTGGTMLLTGSSVRTTNNIIDDGSGNGTFSGALTASNLSGTNTGDQKAGTGLTLTSGSFNIGTTGVTAGTYQGIVVNAQGQVTSASNQSYGTGSVTSVAVSGANGIGVSGSPITTNGTFALSLGNITPTAVTASGQVGAVYGTNGYAVSLVQNTIAGSANPNSAAAFEAATPTANSYLLLGVYDNVGTPYSKFNVGSAVLSSYWAAPNFNFQNLGGTNMLVLSVGSGAFTGVLSASNLSGTNTGDVKINGTTATTVTLGGGLTFTSGTLNTASNTAIAAPQGRLSLTSSNAVMNTNFTSGTVYYIPFVGNTVPVFNGTNFVPLLIGTPSSLVLTSTNNVLGGIYDIFALSNSGTIVLGCGPAWTNGSTRSLSLSSLNGIWVSGSSATYTAGTSSSTIPANQATYLGSIYCSAAGTTTFIPISGAVGGGNNILGVYNAYNQINVKAISYDTSTSWTYSGTVWRSANNSNSNRIYWLDGLAQSYFKADYYVLVTPGTAQGDTGIAINGSGSPGLPSYVGVAALSTPEETQYASVLYAPVAGFNYAQAVELSNGGAITFTSSSGLTQNLILTLNM